MSSPRPERPDCTSRRPRPGERRPTPDAAHSSGPSTAPHAPPRWHTEPWRFELSPDRLVIRADRTRQLTTLDPIGRELVQSVGAALFNARRTGGPRVGRGDRPPARPGRPGRPRGGPAGAGPPDAASPPCYPRPTGGGRTTDASREGTCRTRSCGG